MSNQSRTGTQTILNNKFMNYIMDNHGVVSEYGIPGATIYKWISELKPSVWMNPVKKKEMAKGY